MSGVWALALLALVGACANREGSTNNVARERDGLSSIVEISPPFAVSPLTGTKTQSASWRVLGDDEDLLIFDVMFDSLDHYLTGMRVTKAGAVLDPNGFLIAKVRGGLQGAPTVGAFTGDGWLLAYSASTSQLAAVHVGKDASVGTASTVDGYVPSGVAWNGTRALLTINGGTGIFLDATGAPLGPSFTMFTSPLGGVYTAGGVGTDGSIFVVEFASNQPYSAAYAATVTNSGPTGYTTTLYNAHPSYMVVSGSPVALGPGSFIAYYSAPGPQCPGPTGGCNPQSYCQHLSVAPDGSFTDGGTPTLGGCGGPTTPPWPSQVVTVPDQVWGPLVTYAGDHYVVAWRDEDQQNDAFGVRLSTDGAVLDSTPFALGFFANAATANGQSSLFARFNAATVGALVDAGGSVSAVSLSSFSNQVNVGALASDGEHFLAAASLSPSSGPPPPRSQSLVLSAGGAVEASGDFALADTGLALAFDGTNYVAAWSFAGSSDRELRATRITPAGVTLDDPPKTLLHYPLSAIDAGPQIAAGGGATLVTWGESPDSTTSVIRAALVDPSLEVSAGPVTIGTSVLYPQSSLQLAWDGTNFWVGWVDDASGNELYVRRLASDLTLLDAGPVAVSDVRDSWFGMAASNNQVLVAYRSTDYAYPIKGRFLTSKVDSTGTGGAGTGGTSAGTGGTSASTGGTSASTGGSVGSGGSAGTGGTGGAAGNIDTGGSAGAPDVAGGSAGASADGGEPGRPSGGDSGEAGAGTLSSGGTTAAGAAGASGSSNASGGSATESGGRGGTPGTGGNAATDTGGATGGSGARATGGTDDQSGGQTGGVGGSATAGKAAGGEAAGGKATGGGNGAEAGNPGGHVPGRDAGCGCSVPSTTQAGSGVWAFAALAFSVLRRRRHTFA